MVLMKMKPPLLPKPLRTIRTSWTRTKPPKPAPSQAKAGKRLIRVADRLTG
jgi:hypothetical protein